MAIGASRWLLAGAVCVCLAWAGVEARGLSWRFGGDAAVGAAAVVDAARVEESYADVRQLVAGGDDEQALLLLRQRARRGPYPGYAAFLLGEMAYREASFIAAVQHYRRAVERQPAWADLGGVLRTAEIMDQRLADLVTGPWREQRPREIRDLYFLRRRLGGGCE